MKSLVAQNKIVKNKSAYQIVKYMSLAGMIVALSGQASWAATNPNTANIAAETKTAAKSTVKTNANANAKAPVTIVAASPKTGANANVKAINNAPKKAANAQITNKIQSANQNANKVTTKTSTGKTVTYDCSKAGNKTKKACQS